MRYSLEGEGVVVFAGLAVPDKVATLLTESQQILGIASADGSVIPSGERQEGSQNRVGQAPPLTSEEAQCPRRAAADSSLPWGGSTAALSVSATCQILREKSDKPLGPFPCKAQGPCSSSTPGTLCPSRLPCGDRC